MHNCETVCLEFTPDKGQLSIDLKFFFSCRIQRFSCTMSDSVVRSRTIVTTPYRYSTLAFFFGKSLSNHREDRADAQPRYGFDWPEQLHLYFPLHKIAHKFIYLGKVKLHKKTQRLIRKHASYIFTYTTVTTSPRLTHGPLERREQRLHRGGQAHFRTLQCKISQVTYHFFRAGVGHVHTDGASHLFRVAFTPECLSLRTWIFSPPTSSGRHAPARYR